MVSSLYPQISITYFDLPGRAEPTRLALYIAGIPFEDERLKRDEWPVVKTKAPFGQCPLMTVDGQVYAQSNAILRFAGRIAGLYPSEPIKGLPVDMVLDKLGDISDTLKSSMYENDMDKKLAIRKTLVGDVLPPHFTQLDRFLCKQNPHFAVGESLTIADLVIFNLVNWFKSGVLEGIPADFASKFDNVTKVCETVGGHSKVQEWYKNNPVKRGPI